MVTQSASPNLSFVLCVFSIMLVPFAAAGIALINTGLGRARSAAHSMLSSACGMAVAAFAYYIIGFGVQGIAGGRAHFFNMQGVAWNWISGERFFLRGIPFDGSTASLVALLGMIGAGIAAVIPIGSGSDRWRLGPFCLTTAVFASLTFPLFAHWVWGGGWLASLGTSYGLGNGFIDAGGAATINVTGGFTALSITWILRSRRGRFASDGLPAAIPGHNLVYALIGSILAMVGWMGLNCAGSILFLGADPGRVVLVILNTLLSAGSALIASLITTKIRFRMPDASLAANGWVGGLVAISAACAVVNPAYALVIGGIAGAIVPLSAELLEIVLKIDDPGGAISTHAVSGLWGVLAVGLFADSTRSGQLLAQLVGLATLVGLALPLTYSLTLLVDRFYPQRVELDGERYGLDLYELGAGAYPDFTTHAEDFNPD